MVDWIALLLRTRVQIYPGLRVSYLSQGPPYTFLDSFPN